MNITAFQALTLLAEKYRNHPEMYAKVRSLYLSGIKTLDDEDLFCVLLDDELLSEHTVMLSRREINNDPVRRYFESQLCHETLAISLDELNYDLLNYAHLEVLNEIKTHGLWTSYKHLLETPMPGDENYHIRMENTESIRILNKPRSYQSLMPKNIDENEAIKILIKRKNKMLLLAQISYASWHFGFERGDLLPLNIYSSVKGPYNQDDRGRKCKRNQTVQSPTLGIMRSYMPLSHDDALLSVKPARYLRPADKSSYISGAKQPEQGFKTLVSPFSNSISGTMLVQLQVMAKLMFMGNFVYTQNETQLSLYFKSYIAYMIYHSGGHSLDEYTRVLQLPDVQETFSSEPGFANLKLDTLFRDENILAFEEAVSKTITYNQHILHKKQLSVTLKAGVKLREIDEKIPVPHQCSRIRRVSHGEISIVGTKKNTMTFIDSEPSEYLPNQSQFFYQPVSENKTGISAQESISPTSVAVPL